MQTDNKIHLSLLGGSPLNDILDLQGEAGTYTVDRAVINIHPISMVQDSPLLTEGDGWLSKLKGNADRLQIRLDMTKEAFDYLFEVKSDYLLIDTSTLSKNIVRTAKGCATVIEPGFLGKLSSAGDIGATTELSYTKLDKNLLTEALDTLADKVLSEYPQERIILVESKCSAYVYNPANGLCRSYNRQQASVFDEAMQFGFKHLKDRLPEARVIPFPAYMLGGMDHKDGFTPLSHMSDYYKYALSALNSIVFIAERSASDAAVKKACGILSDSMLRLTLKTCSNTIAFLRDIEKKAKGAQTLSDKLAVGEDDMFNMITEPGCIENIRQWFAERNIRTCALHGLNAISKLYIALFKKWNIFPAYIVDDYTAEERYNGILIVKRNQDEYPEVNCMLICDSWIDKVQAQLNSIGYKGLVTDYKTLMTQKKEEENKA